MPTHNNVPGIESSKLYNCKLQFDFNLVFLPPPPKKKCWLIDSYHHIIIKWSSDFHKPVKKGFSKEHLWF